MRTKELINAAHERLLTKVEEAELLFLLSKKTPAEFKAAVNAAYAAAKKYERFGGSKLHNEVLAAFDKLGSSDFKVLYAAVRFSEKNPVGNIKLFDPEFGPVRL